MILQYIKIARSVENGQLYAEESDGTIKPILVDVYGIPNYGSLIVPEHGKWKYVDDPTLLKDMRAVVLEVEE